MKARGGVRAAGGFTLIEATVSLALLALLVGVVAPNMARWYAGVALRVSMGEVHQAVAALQSQAVFGARDIALLDALTPQGLATKQMPSGWTLSGAAQASPSATFLRNGACTPGEAWIEKGSERLRVQVRNALCELVVSRAVPEAGL
jgi:Tfp pilus assembly protein FimT